MILDQNPFAGMEPQLVCPLFPLKVPRRDRRVSLRTACTDANEYDGFVSPPDLNRKAAADGKGSRVITGLDLIRRQFLALFIKRFHYARRSRKGLVAQVIASVCQADEGPSG